MLGESCDGIGFSGGNKHGVGTLWLGLGRSGILFFVHCFREALLCGLAWLEDRVGSLEYVSVFLNAFLR